MKPFARTLPLLLAAVAAVGALVGACGADNEHAPRPERAPGQLQGCRTLPQLMPRFLGAVSTGQTEGLRRVVHDYLMASKRGDVVPPLPDVLRAVFSTLAGFAKLPPERAAPPGQVCVPSSAVASLPPVSQAHPLCEMRRATETLVHQGKGVEALELIDPLVAGTLNYVVGRRPSSATPHYEIAAVLGKMCQQSGPCQLSDTLDLVIGLTAYLESTDGKALGDHLNGLMNNPVFKAFLAPGGDAGVSDAGTALGGGENGAVAFTRLLSQTVRGMKDPAELDNLPLGSLPVEVRGDLQTLLADLKRLLDPRREPNVLRPLQKWLNCLNTADPNLELVRMLYRLSYDAKLPEFALGKVSKDLQKLRDVDQRGSLIHLAQTISLAIRQDEQAVDSAALACRQLFSTEVPVGQSRSNAELALPVAADLFSQGVAGEAICAVDTLVFGCAGGAQPACSLR